MKYDDASWHYGGNFPENLPHKAASTHIGMFLAWLIFNDFASNELIKTSTKAIAALKKHIITGALFLDQELDGQLVDTDFNDIGNAFIVAYYEGKYERGAYLNDYIDTLFADNMSSIYEVKDTWNNYAKIEKVINKRFATWNAKGRPKYL